jgi:hypothetical protein
MLKHFAAAALGLAVLFGAIGPAAAGKGGHYGHYWISPSPYVYLDDDEYYVTRKSYRSQPNIQLDRETESVWRNLRPEWFDD